MQWHGASGRFLKRHFWKLLTVSTCPALLRSLYVLSSYGRQRKEPTQLMINALFQEDGCLPQIKLRREEGKCVRRAAQYLVDLCCTSSKFFCRKPQRARNLTSFKHSQ